MEYGGGESLGYDDGWVGNSRGFKILNGCSCVGPCCRCCAVLCCCCCPAVRSVVPVVADCLALSRTRRLGVGLILQ